MPFSHRDLWSTAHVNKQLASGPMSEGKTFLYFLAITGFDWLQFTGFRLSQSPEPIPTWGYFDAWFALAGCEGVVEGGLTERDRLVAVFYAGGDESRHVSSYRPPSEMAEPSGSGVANG